ncbi:MAG: hypothetical protein MRY74_12835 [Neomegalonema sp.]|nr:hypothetical protein [Neomegalonema sp.]
MSVVRTWRWRLVALVGLCASVYLVGARATGLAKSILAIEPKAGVAETRLLFLPEDRARLDAPVAPGEIRITVTGAYTSAEAPRPEGFTIRAGNPTRPWPQGWDGLLVIDAKGRASIHDVSQVKLGEKSFNLRAKPERKAFVDLATRGGFSVIQSHLLIREGVLDLKKVDGAPVARRRLLFQTTDGRIGIFDSTPKVMTLYEAARSLQEMTSPAMALNLDTGTYDFCEIRTVKKVRPCGLLGRSRVEALTNLFEFSLLPR